MEYSIYIVLYIINLVLNSPKRPRIIKYNLVLKINLVTNLGLTNFLNLFFLCKTIVQSLMFASKSKVSNQVQECRVFRSSRLVVGFPCAANKNFFFPFLGKFSVSGNLPLKKENKLLHSKSMPNNQKKVMIIKAKTKI